MYMLKRVCSFLKWVLQAALIIFFPFLIIKIFLTTLNPVTVMDFVKEHERREEEYKTSRPSWHTEIRKRDCAEQTWEKKPEQ